MPTLGDQTKLLSAVAVALRVVLLPLQMVISVPAFTTSAGITTILGPL